MAPDGTYAEAAIHVLVSKHVQLGACAAGLERTR